VHFNTYTCYNCHEHTPAKIERIHSRRNIANAKLNDCVSCHGRKRDRRAAVGMELEGLAEVCLREGEGEPAFLCPEFRKNARPTGDALETTITSLRLLGQEKVAQPVSRDAEPRSGAAERGGRLIPGKIATPFFDFVGENKLLFRGHSVMLE